jgi:hypothetical protein
VPPVIAACSPHVIHLLQMPNHIPGVKRYLIYLITRLNRIAIALGRSYKITIHTGHFRNLIMPPAPHERNRLKMTTNEHGRYLYRFMHFKHHTTPPYIEHLFDIRIRSPLSLVNISLYNFDTLFTVW